MSLINKIKTENNSDSLSELIERHSGVYQYVVDKFSKSPNAIIDRDFFLEDKQFVIYESALQYDPSKNTKFSTFLANKTRWKCLNAISKDKKYKPVSLEVLKDIKNDQNSLDNPSNFALAAEAIDIFNKMLDNEEDERIKKIIDIRYNTSNNKLTPWRKAAEELGLSIQWVITIHNRFINKVKKQIQKDYV
ncbi:MAG: hypothetical protein HWN81_02005 [Candidatus Lokiarchaeota archaeon]|nr:hypothetical protein [Candidatus Lokiarchaeota archaeon]